MFVVASVCSAMFGCKPATFTPRIVDNEDGTYTTEYYWPYPGYTTDPYAHRVSLEKARVAAQKWTDIATNKASKTIVIVE